jgi:L-erythrulose 1-phosphate isomerase
MYWRARWLRRCPRSPRNTVRRRSFSPTEPVWSIGEGGTPAEPAFVNEQHVLIKALTERINGRPLPVLYGGSVNPGNCRELAAQSHVDGLFIGRSAWAAEGYVGILEVVAGTM